MTTKTPDSSTPRRKVTWLGPKVCDLCQKAPGAFLYDAMSPAHGSWATMCKGCFSYSGAGLGTGRGQEYKLDKESGEYVKVRG